MDVEAYLEKFRESLTAYGPALVAALRGILADLEPDPEDA